MFADDVKIYKSISSVQDCALLQADLERFSEWLYTNGLQLSVHKCAVMEFSRSRSPPVFSYRIDSETLPFVNHIKDLGIYLDKTLSFSFHINKICSKASGMLGFLFRSTKDFSNVLPLKILYCSLVRGILEFASPVWNPFYDIHSTVWEKGFNIAL
ncbi:hypothetical protein WDU94_003684 [Cyamophila willieti]